MSNLQFITPNCALLVVSSGKKKQQQGHNKKKKQTQDMRDVEEVLKLFHERLDKMTNKIYCKASHIISHDTFHRNEHE